MVKSLYKLSYDNTETLQLPNFGYMTMPTMKKFFGDVFARNYDVIAFVSKCFYLANCQNA